MPKWEFRRPIVTIDNGDEYFLQGEASKLEVREVTDTMVPSFFGRSIVLEPRAFEINGHFHKLNTVRRKTTLTDIYLSSPNWLWRFIDGKIIMI